MPNRRPDIAAAIEQALIGTPDSPCVLWPGEIKESGYGRMRHKEYGRNARAHRVIWLMAGNEIPDGLTIDHACHDPLTCPGGRACLHRRCINVGHLRLATREEQMRNSVLANQITCVNGHPWTDENIIVQTTGKRVGRRWCRICKQAKDARRRAKKRQQRRS